MKVFFYKRVRYDEIDSYLRLGWIAQPPNGGSYQHLYGIILSWICSCPPPLPKKDHTS